MTTDPNIITLYADETQDEQAVRLRALYTNPDTFFFALDDHKRDDLPFNPVPADAWVWSHGDRWQAIVAGFHADDWWEGSDPADIAARPDPWFRPITDVPTTGTLEYNLRDGTLRIAQANEDELHPFRATVQIDLEATDEGDAADRANRLAQEIENMPDVTNVWVESVH